MIRNVCFTLAVVAGGLGLFAASADAAPRLSANNPYRSFNISGYNYGSLRWERSHGYSGRGGHAYGGRGILRRR